MPTKTLKFTEDLIPLILSGQKTSTWRLFDDKNLTVGDELALLNKITGKQFAQAIIISIKEKPLEQIDQNDFEGHESFGGRDKMIQWYKAFYGNSVTEDSIVKMIEFELIEAK